MIQSPETENRENKHKSAIINRLKIKTTNWNWQKSNWKITNTWMQCMILKANTLSHLEDHFWSWMKSTDHGYHGFGHSMHWISHCNSCDVHVGTHWVHVVDSTSSSQIMSTQGFCPLEGFRELGPWVQQ